MPEQEQAIVVVPEAEHEGGMPQLNFDDYAPQLVWLALIFVALYLLLSRIALPRVASAIEGRRNRVAHDIDEAARLKREADEALAAYEQALADARGQAHNIAAEMRERVNADMAAQRAALDKRLERQTAEAEARIRATRDAAMGNVRQIAVETTEALVTKLLGQPVTRDAATRAVDAELGAEEAGEAAPAVLRLR